MMSIAVAAMTCFTAYADFQINSKADLETFRNNVNGGNTYSGQTVYLNVDIDLEGASWTPIANTTNADGNGFQGTFDGKGHKISNFKCATEASGTDKNAIAGLFGVNRGTIKNLMVTGADCDANAQGGSMNSSAAGAIAGVNRGTISNCAVTSSDIYAYIYYGYVGGYSHAGGIVGAQVGDGQIVNCYIYNCTVKADKRSVFLGSNVARSNTISNKWGAAITDNTQTNCCTSTGTYSSSWRAERNNAAIAYVNNFGGAVAEPYWWDANGITPHIPYAFRIENPDASTIRTNATYAKHGTFNEQYSNGGYTYDIFPQNYTIGVTTHPAGIAINGDDAGYIVKSVNIGTLGSTENTSSHDGTRYYRSQAISGITTPNSYPANATVLTYSTEHTGLYKLAFADHGSDVAVRDDAKIITPATKVACPAGGEFDMYPAGSSVVAEFYLEGFSGDWTNAGYYVNEITDNNGNVLAGSNDATYLMPEDGMDEEGNPTFSFESGRFLRKQQFTITMPFAPTTLYYTTMTIIPSSVEDVEAAARVYGANGMVVVEAGAEGNVTVVDMAGRVVYNGKVSEGRNELALDRGFYIVNGTKVIVR